MQLEILHNSLIMFGSVHEMFFWYAYRHVPYCSHVLVILQWWWVSNDNPLDLFPTTQQFLAHEHSSHGNCEWPNWSQKFLIPSKNWEMIGHHGKMRWNAHLQRFSYPKNLVPIWTRLGPARIGLASSITTVSPRLLKLYTLQQGWGSSSLHAE